MPKPDGGSAFPIVLPSSEPVRSPGITVRDYFAGQFLSSMRVAGHIAPDVIADRCYAMADAMLAARAKEDGQ